MNGIRMAREQLQNEWSRLNHRWQVTSGQWNDVVRWRFEQEFWQEYEPHLRAVLKELADLEHVFDRARREIS